MIELGNLLTHKSKNDELAGPIFVWAIIEETGKCSFLINSETGMSKRTIEVKFPEQKIILPNHAKFKLVSKEALEASFVPSTEPDYSLVSDWIRLTKDKGNMVPEFFVNIAYGFMHIVHKGRFINSQYCKSIEDKIYADPYSLIVTLDSIKNEGEREKQNFQNMVYLITLDFIPKRFVILKIISKAKDIMHENFPPENDTFSNSIIEKLLLGMFLSYYKANKDKINKVTINYGQKFPGDFKVFQQFTSMLHKFEEEMGMYQSVSEEELKLELNAKMSGLKLPQREEGRGIIMKLLEFDLGFWQRLILLDINEDVPVRKPYKDGFSISYNYMLLLPFFQWLAPHLFPQYEDKKVNAENYNKVVVERMKSFVEGKVS
jgi:hypothetical protein